MTLGMFEILRGGGFTTGGLNFDAKLRRQSIDRTDLFYAPHRRDGHHGESTARAAASVRDELDSNRERRYAGWAGALGSSILDGTTTLSALHERAFDGSEPERVSGGQERLENLVARHVARVQRMTLVAGVDSSTTATKVEVRELESGRGRRAGRRRILRRSRRGPNSHPRRGGGPSSRRGVRPANRASRRSAWPDSSTGSLPWTTATR